MAKADVAALFAPRTRQPVEVEIEGLGKVHVLPPTFDTLRMPAVDDSGRISLADFCADSDALGDLVAVSIVTADGEPVLDTDAAREWARTAPVTLAWAVGAAIVGAGN